MPKFYFSCDTAATRGIFLPLPEHVIAKWPARGYGRKTSPGPYEPYFPVVVRPDVAMYYLLTVEPGNANIVLLDDVAILCGWVV